MRNLTLAALLLAAPLPALAQAPPAATAPAAAPSAAATAMPTTAAEYLAMAAAGDLYEKTSSQMMLETPQANAELRRFAQEMVEDHTDTTNRLTQAAQRAGVPPPGTPRMTPQHQAMVEQLRAANGAQRDRIYLSQQMQAHQQALALHQAYAQRGDNPALREAAQLTAQAVQDHLQMLQRLRVAD